MRHMHVVMRCQRSVHSTCSHIISMHAVPRNLLIPTLSLLQSQQSTPTTSQQPLWPHVICNYAQIRRIIGIRSPWGPIPYLLLPPELPPPIAPLLMPLKSWDEVPVLLAAWLPGWLPARGTPGLGMLDDDTGLLVSAREGNV